MRRLYWQVYLTFVGILLLFGILLSFAFFTVSSRDNRGLAALAALSEELLPAPGSTPEDLQEVLARLQRDLQISAAVWDATGALDAAIGEPLPRPAPAWKQSRFLPSRGAGLTAALALSDGRWVIVRHHREARASTAVFSVLLILGVAVALGAYPLVRRLTGRVERLKARVDALGAGELGARVEVEGRDEVAGLALSFNQAAARIERLVDAQKTLLAGVSHELRSPLARLRVALELLGDDVRPELRERISEDISELDELIGELLLAARLDTLEAVDIPDEVDLLALAAEEAARHGGVVSGERVRLRGDRRLLRRLVANLLSNASRHAGDAPAEVTVVPLEPDGASLVVADRGPGVPKEERQRIFEAFYRAKSPVVARGDGVGLGLALVKRIAQHHGGDARCLPRPGGGTLFEVSLRSLGQAKEKAGR